MANSLIAAAGCRHPYRLSVATRLPGIRRCTLCGWRGPWDCFDRLV